MWAITNHTPYKVESTWGRDNAGVHEWIVAVKGTFDIKPDGRVKLADEQIDPLLIPEYVGETGKSSLRYDADLTAPKPTTDVIANATAYAPRGRPSTEFLVELRVGSIHKVLKVTGNRTWRRGIFGLKSSSVEPVTTVPIIYERAYGGYDHVDPDPRNHRMDFRNPVGCGMVAKPKHRLGQPLPNVVYPKGSMEKSGPAGFGAIDSHWSPRRELVGTYDTTWQQNRLPLLPRDWDARWLQCSPVDQRPGTYLQGGEVVELVNLTSIGLLRFALPNDRLTFRTRFITRVGRVVKEHDNHLATVIIEPDYPRVIMAWQSSLVCRTDIDYLEETVVRQEIQT